MILCFDVDLYSQNVVTNEFDQLFTTLETWCAAITKTGLFVVGVSRKDLFLTSYLLLWKIDGPR